MLLAFDIEVVDAKYLNDGQPIAGGGTLPNGDFQAALLVPASSEEIAAANAVGTSKSASVTAHTFIKNSLNSAPRGRSRTLNVFRRIRGLP